MSVAMAKARLRAAGARLGVKPWIQRHPMQTLVIAATGGFLAGRAPDCRGLSATGLLRSVVRLLL